MAIKMSNLEIMCGVRLTREEAQTIKEIAEESDRTVSFVIRYYMLQGMELAEHEPEPEEQDG